MITSAAPPENPVSIIKMIDAVTTNKTEFFREQEHFSILRDRVLPELSSTERFRQGNPIQIWSAGCSTGEEPYTIAMVTSEYFMGERAPVSILATDISTKVLSSAINGVYPEKIIDPIPLSLKKKYILRGKGENKGLFRITPEIRRMINFSKLNLMDERFIFNREMDIVFCRNVLFYFSEEFKTDIYTRIAKLMGLGGVLFIGASESIISQAHLFTPHREARGVWYEVNA